jgi:hypothetical protein
MSNNKFDSTGRLIRGVKEQTLTKSHGFDKSHSQEYPLVIQFSEHFGVTYASHKSDFPFVFLQPDEKMQRNFNLSNEFLLLFSHYASFDTRSFDVVDKILEEFSNRLDRLCIFVVSNDSNFLHIIDKKLANQQDFRLVVPFTYEEILSRRPFEDFLFERLRKYLYTRDLFAQNTPLTSNEFFFGRSQIIQKLTSRYSNGQQSGLFGLRRIGKTSVLFALMRTLEHRNGVSVYIDCQSPTIHSLRWFELLKEVLNSLCNQYPVDLNVIDLVFDEKNASRQFELGIEEVYSKLGQNKLLIIFDEIENITYNLSPNNEWRRGPDFLFFWQTIRSIIQRKPHLFSFVIAGVNPYIIEEPSIDNMDNPLFGMLSVDYLDFFSLQDVRDMVSRVGGYMGLTFDEEVYTHLVDDFGGHPFLVRQVCSMINQLAQSKPYNLDKYVYKQHRYNFEDGLATYIEQIMKVLKDRYPHELDLLKTLVLDGHDQFLEIRKNQTTINHLIGYGVIVDHNGHYSVTIDAIRNYISNTYKSNSLPTTVEKRWAIISDRRNRLEVSLRNVIRITLLASKGRGTTKNILLGLLKTDEIASNRTKTIDYILENKIYFNQLKGLVMKEWKDFCKIFDDKTMFSQTMDTINTYRVDAHAKTIDDSAFFQVNYSFDWLEKKLNV